MNAIEFRLDDGRGLPIVGDVRLPDGSALAPVVVLAHGWLGWKDWGFLPILAEKLAAEGLVAVSFNFSCSGVPAGRDEIVEEDLFASNTFTREVEDLERMVTAVFERMIAGRERFDIRQIATLGYDAGGAVALIEAAGDSRVKAIVSIAAPARLESLLPEEAFAAWLTRGEYEFKDKRTNRKLRLPWGFFRDLRARRAQLDSVAAAQALRAPYLVLHGDEDRVVPLADGRAIFFANSEYADLQVLKGADHTLGANHPMGAPTEAVGAACESVRGFFSTKLGLLKRS